MGWLRRNRRDVLSTVFLIALLGAVYLLPPDTSLRMIQETGVLRVCVPSSYPPLVTGDSARPGIDIEIMTQVAQELGVRLLTVTNPNMGRDFNPRNWRVTRAQCAVLAGGVVASETTRSFLETTRPYLATGWAMIAPEDPGALQGQAVGFHAGVSGLDRIALSAWLRQQGASVQIFNSSASLAAALAAGEVAAGFTEAVLASQLAGANDWQGWWLPEELPREQIAFGLWKGDLTLKRALQNVLGRMHADGTMQALLDSYDMAVLSEPLLP